MNSLYLALAAAIVAVVLAGSQFAYETYIEYHEPVTVSHEGQSQ